MLKRTLVLAVISGVALAGSAPAQSQLFDASKAERELGIMSGILSTTIQYVSSSGEHRRAHWTGGGDVKSIYLYDQGAIFLVPISSRRMGVSGNLRLLEAKTLSEMEAVTAGGEIDRDRLAELQDEIKEKEKALKQGSRQYRERLEKVREFLIEAVANHGDSLTVVGDDEYINLVLQSAGGMWSLSPSSAYVFSGSGAFAVSGKRNRSDVVQVKMSWIRDYKAGRITLEQLKDQVLVY